MIMTIPLIERGRVDKNQFYFPRTGIIGVSDPLGRLHVVVGVGVVGLVVDELSGRQGDALDLNEDID